MLDPLLPQLVPIAVVVTLSNVVALVIDLFTIPDYSPNSF